MGWMDEHLVPFTAVPQIQTVFSTHPPPPPPRVAPASQRPRTRGAGERIFGHDGGSRRTVFTRKGGDGVCVEIAKGCLRSYLFLFCKNVMYVLFMYYTVDLGDPLSEAKAEPKPQGAE